VAKTSLKNPKTGEVREVTAQELLEKRKELLDAGFIDTQEDDVAKGGRADSAPGQNKDVTLTNPTTGESQTLRKSEIRQRRQELRDQGWTGPGLTDSEVEELEDEGEE
jgi:hypothetical protein